MTECKNCGHGVKVFPTNRTYHHTDVFEGLGTCDKIECWVHGCGCTNPEPKEEAKTK